MNNRLVVVSNRVSSIVEGKKAVAGGLAVGVFDALKHMGGLWFGWNGEIVDALSDEVSLKQHDNVTFATMGLSRADYDQYYRGFSNGTL